MLRSSSQRGDDGRQKKDLLHPGVLRILSSMGHTDTVVIADAGLPIPPEVERIDLALTPGTPGFLEVLEVVTGWLAVERATLASEMESRSPELYAATRDLLRGVAPAASAKPAKDGGVQVERIPHEDFKRHTKRAVAIIRTGETTPYANVILEAGVTF